MPDSAWLQGVLRKAVAAIIGFMLAFVLLVALLITGFTCSSMPPCWLYRP